MVKLIVLYLSTSLVDARVLRLLHKIIHGLYTALPPYLMRGFYLCYIRLSKGCTKHCSLSQPTPFGDTGHQLYQHRLRSLDLDLHTSTFHLD